MAGTVLLLGALARILAASLATALALHLSLPGGPWLAAGLTALAVLVLAEAVPAALPCARPRIWPAALPRPWLRCAASPGRRGFGGRRARGAGLGPGRDCRCAGRRPVQRHRAQDQRDRLLGALDLAERSVEEIMLHRSNIQMIEAGLPADAVLDLVLKSPHTRLPVYRDERENVVGVIHARTCCAACAGRYAKAAPRAARL